jgi:hypothetical protein
MEQQQSKHAVVICTFLQIDEAELARIIHEEPSWFKQKTHTGEYLLIDNSLFHKESDKRYQLQLLVEHIDKLCEVLGSDDDVLIFLHRPRKKLRGQSFANIAKKSASPLPEYNGLQDLIDHIQNWFRRKSIR